MDLSSTLASTAVGFGDSEVQMLRRECLTVTSTAVYLVKEMSLWASVLCIGDLYYFPLLHSSLTL